VLCCVSRTHQECVAHAYSMFSALVKYTRTLAQHSSRTHPPVNMTYQERALNISQSHIYTARLFYIVDVLLLLFSFYSSALYICAAAAGCVCRTADTLDVGGCCCVYIPPAFIVYTHHHLNKKRISRTLS
jgi:hypothetical protein